MINLTPYETILYSVIYDRFRFKRYHTTLSELATESNVNKNTTNSLLNRLAKKGVIRLSRKYQKGIIIEDVKRI